MTSIYANLPLLRRYIYLISIFVLQLKETVGEIEQTHEEVIYIQIYTILSIHNVLNKLLYQTYTYTHTGVPRPPVPSRRPHRATDEVP